MFDLYRLLTVIINFFPCFINDVTAADIENERISSNFLWNLPHYYGRIFAETDTTEYCIHCITSMIWFEGVYQEP